MNSREDIEALVREIRDEAARHGIEIRGLALIGDEYSVVSMGDGVALVKTREVDWNHLYLHYKWHPVIIVVGITLVAISLAFLAMTITSTGPMAILPMDAKFFSIMIPLIMGILFLCGSRIKASLKA